MKNKNTFLQIGMPKTATTTLQKEIFPELCKYTKYNYWRDDITLVDEILLNKYKLLCSLPLNPIVIPANSLISLESLIGTDPKYWEKNSIGIKNTFGNHAHILIVLRDPKSYLNSIYAEECIHSGVLQRPEHYFLRKSEYSERHTGPKFSIDDFNYNNLIGYYKKNFKYVTIVKFKKLPELEFISDFFDITTIQHHHLKSLFNKKIHNRRISNVMVEGLFFINKVLNQMGLSLGIQQNNRSVDSLRKNKIPRKKPNIGKLILLKFLRKLDLLPALRAIENLFKMKKFELDFSKLKYINLNELEEMYEKIPDYITYTR